MSVEYNRIAGRNLDRIAAISDGIFAVAMTLLVLDLKVPAAEGIHTSADLLRALWASMPQFLTYFISFSTLGIFWLGQQAQLNYATESDRKFTWIHLVFLLGVTLLPFSTRLLAEFVMLRAALLLYWANILFLGALLYASWRYATYTKLISDDADEALRCAIERRILLAQALYAGSAALCFIDTRISIACIFLLQVNFVLAPKLPWLKRV